MERKAFVELCGKRKTLERIQSLFKQENIKKLKLLIMKTAYIVGGYRSAVGIRKGVLDSLGQMKWVNKLYNIY